MTLLTLLLFTFTTCSASSFVEQLSSETEALLVHGKFAAADKLLTAAQQAQGPVTLNDLGLVRFLLNGDTREVARPKPPTQRQRRPQ